MHRPLGCLTGTGLIAGVATLGIVILAAFLSGNGIFSPGALNGQTGPAPLGGVQSHAELAQDCAACHPMVLSGTYMGDLCLDCHTETGDEINDPAGFHFGFANPANCRQCHTDHRGPQASLTRQDMLGFPHERSGFWLTTHPMISEGGSFMCGECHTSSLVEFEINACRSCHLAYDQDFLVDHINTFGPDCLNCHDGLDTYGTDFDHDATAFILEGWHELAECSACHSGAPTIEILRQTPTRCYDCHQTDDIHQLRLGIDCGQCHSAAGWEDARLDHARTGFPLEGQHAELDCETCHVDRQWVGLPDTCAGCHLPDDIHGGQFEQDCVQCHQPTTWADLIFDHDQSGFPLEASHAEAACADCHQEGRYANTPNRCVDCHAGEDAHDGRYGTDCSACHRPTTWQDATFDHNLSNFPLTGAHVSLACESCHSSGTFAGLSTACAACHAEPALHAGLFGPSCQNCHNTSAWRPASFNGPHSFPMNHGGAGGQCSRCHPSTYASYTCFSCHEHNESELRKKHSEEGIGNISNCLRCHPGGRHADD